MRRRSWLAVVLSLPWIGACWLATDWDAFSNGAKAGPAASDGGDAATVLRDGAPASSSGGAGEGGVAGGDEAGIEGGATGPTYGDLVLADAPVGYWPFDEPAGATVVTEHVSGKKATPSKASEFTFGAPGVAGVALGSTGKADLGFGDMLDFIGKEAWTVEAWIKPEYESSNKVFYEYVNKRDNGNGLVFYVRHENGETTVQVEQSYNGGGRGVDHALADAPLRFHHIVFVYDPGKTGIRCWVDGQRGDKGYDDNGGPTDNPQQLYVASGIKGTIDELAIYDKALPDDRILAHFHKIVP